MVQTFVSVEGECTAVDTKTQLTTLGSRGTVTPILVPGGSQQISAVMTAFTENYAVAGSASVFIRLEGPGLPAGPEVITLGCVGTTTTDGGTGGQPSVITPLGVPVKQDNEVQIFAEMAGTDVGQVNIGVTLVFE